MRAYCASFTVRPLRVAALLCGGMIAASASANDLSATAILAPVAGCALTATENVTLRIFNFGPNLPSGTSFNASYSVNSGGPVTEFVVLGGPLLANSQYLYTFTTQANLSVPGSYTFDATVSLAGDTTPSNNAFTGYSVVNSAPSVGGTVSTPPAGSSGVLTLSGQTGSVLRWEESIDGGLRWFQLANTSTTQAYANLRAPTQFRASVQNGSCAAASSGIATATP